MKEKEQSYLEKQLEATVSKTENEIIIVFQRTKVKMQDILEIQFLQTIDPVFQKDIIATEDEIQIIIHFPKTMNDFRKIKQKKAIHRRFFAHQIIKKVQVHSYERLHLLICPENIAFDASLTPYFYHYGVKESLPPYEKDEELQFNQLKAIVATIIDGQYKFEEYLNFHQTLKLTELANEIMQAKAMADLEQIVQQLILDLEKQEKSLVTIPKKQWKFQRYVLLALGILLVPSLLYSLYAIFFQIPKQSAYVKSNDYFLRQQYSNVMDRLERYNPEGMPYIVQYELALSYVRQEALTEEQRKNVLNMITLQTDPKIFLYWIYIGRGMYEEAIDIARSFEDQELIIFGLLKLREQIKMDDSLTGEEKQKKIAPIQTEIDEFEEEQKRLQEEAQAPFEEEQNSGNLPDSEVPSDSNVNESEEQINTEAEEAVTEQPSSDTTGGEDAGLQE
ncbi:type VII secretion protein EssB [Caldibacillus lycopersici]|uniref:Type VII secretion protein EssB n=1 Tax=Perspicuibacillus lycopersici TaxID=1325689 RepID=A0AAE3IQL6_9BACI|nr:type VII secretion protein EssB [Perspicuibacillus lycopersici]MCU9612785.1 type VII secretion protein EssB [Perspicuibacillus lycopersici]